MRPRVDKYIITLREYPFPDSCLLGPIDAFHQENVLHDVRDLEQCVMHAGLPSELRSQIRFILNQNIDMFRVGLSSGPAADLPPFKTDINPTARPVRVKLQNYSFDQRQFLQSFVKDLERHSHVYRYPTAR